jgi:CheY-like chemotaxis protein
VLCRVLIVDDNADLAEATSMMLTICGFNTTTAYNGSLALEKARTFRPEIILLDIGLPDMDGYELASTIRRECGLAATIFIAISARKPDARAPHAREARFDHYLVKPVDLDLLLRLLSKQGP